MALLAQLRPELVAPGQDEPAGRVDLDHLAAAPNGPLRAHQLPGSPGLPLAVLPGPDPELPGELGVEQRPPEFLRRRADVGDVHEPRISHRLLLQIVPSA